ncbi:hypothetical protein DFR50_12788 [Roseiarcus fermentans]|uniref:Uncharacterized protein n=1 Tax=Roseiarcus fermentans TaxID=1473586 RepID=A0A366EYG9_9HYPH|nr:hypothetical protein [Roseiarcus fermentans]RBP07443.1 hypothetical protein DFR50_12788 [Roseiarcus fermentans]
MKPIMLAATLLCAFGPTERAGAADVKVADVRILDVRAYAYLERAGKLSDNLVGGQPLVDAPRGGALGGDTATALLVDVVFQGDGSAASKAAAATVDLTQTTRAGARVVTHKTFDTFAFGGDGVAHKAVFLEGAMCMPLTIEVHAGRSVKSARVDLQCEAVQAQK